ncbi:carbohydrate-binding protein [Vibrio lentus]|uniref:Chitin-binding type-3 domain-containing protein n=1 Tax=Vibrio lentus TaxID=136468 RepID=A0AA44VTT4_9VIBR|nr:carbohydrate-binding protein [Vibrio lentus]MCB5358371.1 hypothetical protein [Vibrio lentus]MCB5448840.1 hypothetical protein [Vibrio lentus]MCB5460727.1 hypothetical protein [Vibrio lentus]MCC4796355.1 hypothetical protein [Vibrio lentus]MCC4853998.1 hypothetical protein [Vibrio lentus]
MVKENNPPIIDLPSIFYVSEGQQLNVAVNAKDPDGDLMDYHWSISPELKIITGEYTKTVTLLAPLVDSDTQYDISVSVSDGEFTVRAESTIQVSDKVVDELPPADTCTDEDSSADNYPAWDASTIYTNELVSHNGLVFKAKWWVKNSEPLVGNEAWELISELELPWSGLVAYSGGDEVNHDDNRWKAKWWTRNDEPGTTGEWGVWRIIKNETTPPTIPGTPTEPEMPSMKWQESKIYNNGDSVIFNGEIWTAYWWTKGEEPGSSGEWGVWRK